MERANEPIIWVLICLAVFSTRASATMGIAVVRSDAVVVGIDSQISGKNPRLSCKLAHNDKMAIIASGTYNFPEGGFEFFEQAKQALASSVTLEGVAEALDNKIRPLMRTGLEGAYKENLPHYLHRYDKKVPGLEVTVPVIEILIGGIDKNGPSILLFRYYAPTPGALTQEHPQRFVIGSDPIVIPMFARIHPPEAWRTTATTATEIYAQLADKIVRNIHGNVNDLGLAGISDPIVTAFIDGSGFHFLDKGECPEK